MVGPGWLRLYRAMGHGRRWCMEWVCAWWHQAITWSSTWWRQHDDVIKWKHFVRYWPFVRGIHRSPVNSPHIGQWRGALVFSLICACINGWINNHEAGDLRRHRAHYDVNVMNKDLCHHLRVISQQEMLVTSATEIRLKIRVLNRTISQIPQCIIQISHNAPFCNRNVHAYAHCVTNGAMWDMGLVHCGICEIALLQLYLAETN